jgi:hypothetical protein
MRKIVELKIEETKNVVGGIKVATTAPAPARIDAGATAQPVTAATFAV